MQETTSNGHEIKDPVSVLSAPEFRQHMAEQFGFLVGSPEERACRLREMSVEGVAILIEDINKTVQGSGGSLMKHEGMVPVGGKETLAPEHRYEVFARLIEDIKAAPEAINPARLGDVLALGVVLLHPFYDGNGRTARTLGLLFRDEYDSDDYASDYDVVTEPRDRARARGGFLIYGYTPRLPEGMDQSDPADVSRYLHDLLRDEREGDYIGCFGRAAFYSEK